MGTGKTYSTKYLLDSNNNSGVAGQVLSTTSTGIDWVDANTVPGTGLWLASGNDIYNSNSGNVGIGVTGPVSAIHAYHATTNVIGTFESGDTNSYINIKDSNSGTYGVLLGTTGDNFIVSPNNAEAMRILANGNVGIGTTSPSRTLHVSTDSGVLIKGASGSTNAKISLLPASGGRQYDLGNVGSDFRIFDASASVTRMYFDNDGNTGIGTTSPDTKLEVRTDSGPASANSYFRVTAGAQGGYGGTAHFEGAYNDYGNVNQPNIVGKIDMASEVVTTTDVGGTMKFFTKATGGTYATAPIERMRIDSSGNVGIGETSVDARLHISALASNGISNVKLESPGASKWAFGIPAGQTYFALDDVNDNLTTPKLVVLKTSGNVGIGTDSPEAKLDVEAGDTGGAQGDSTTAAIFRAGRQNVWFQNQRTAAGTDWNNNTFKIIAKVDTTSHQSINFVNDASYNEHIDIYTGNQVFNTRFTHDGNVGIGTTGPSYKLDVENDSNIIANFESTTNKSAIRISDDDTVGYISAENGRIGFGTSPILSASNITMLTSNNNVGIGTTGPASLLSLQKDDNTVYDPTSDDGQRAIGPTILLNNNSTTTNTFGQIMYDTDSSGQGVARIVFLDAGTASSAIAFVTEQSDSIGERMRIDSVGNVGIGTASPSEKLSLPDNAKIGLGSSADLQIYHNATNSVISNSTGHLYIKTTVADKDIIFEASNGAGSVESYLEIDSDQQDIKVNKRIEMTGTGSAGGQHTIEFNPGTSAIGYIYHDDTNFNVRAVKASSDLVLEATHGNVQILNGNGSGTEVGVMIEQYIAHIGDTDTKFGFTAANQFQVIAGGNTNLNVQGNGVNLSYAGSTRLTTQTGGIAITGDLTVTADVGIGLTNPDVPLHVTANEDGSGIDKGAAKFINTNTGQGATTMHMVQTSSSNFANAVKFWQGSTPTAVGFIRLTTSATQFITSASDLNLKKNITNWSDDTLSKFKALEPKKFRFKTQDVSEDKTLGFIAQNEVDNFPEAYPQFLGDDEQPYYGFNPTGMVPHLMKAIKDLVEKVETLENRITQLENNN